MHKKYYCFQIEVLRTMNMLDDIDNFQKKEQLNIFDKIL